MMSASTGQGRSLARSATDDLSPVLLEYQSPSNALAQLPVPLYARKTSWAIFTMVAAFFGAAAVIKVDRVAESRGHVISLSPTQMIQPLETSILRRINVVPGQAVHKGDLLAELDPTFSGSDTASLEAQARSYSAQVARDQAELDGKPYVAIPGDQDSAVQATLFAQRQAEFTAKFNNYQEKITSLQQKVAGADTDIAAYRDRLAGAQEVEAMRRQLAKMEVGSKLNLLAATDQRQEISRSLNAALATADSGRSDLKAMIQERDGFVQDWRAQIVNEQATALRQYNQANEDLQKAKLRSSLVQMRADSDGVVLTTTPLAPGSVLQSGDPVVSLMPSDTKLQVDAMIDSQEIGFVHLGDPVTLKFDTFQFTQFGTAEGEVLSVSPDSFVAPDASSVAARSPFGGGVPSSTASGSQSSNVNGVPTQLSYYRARISIDKINLHGLPPESKVMPGMTVAADIKVGKRTMIEYLFSRILPTFDEGMREP